MFLILGTAALLSYFGNRKLMNALAKKCDDILAEHEKLVSMPNSAFEMNILKEKVKEIRRKLGSRTTSQNVCTIAIESSDNSCFLKKKAIYCFEKLENRIESQSELSVNTENRSSGKELKSNSKAHKSTDSKVNSK